MKCIQSIFALAMLSATLLAGSAAWACWIQVPLESMVASADVIIVGKIVSIERAPGQADYAYDTGVIKIREVIKGREVIDTLYGSDKRAPLSFPARTNRLRVSTDLRYDKGQVGVWLLTLRQGRLMAARPDSLQPLKRRAEIRKLAAQSPLETDAPPDEGPLPEIKKRRPLPIAIDRME
ncbi:MAG: hypothetical protein JRF63_02200 [Deltaproteobacteria bacterium]|nr:hypothetical protein [Deltaproteobacteria bacterium]